MTTSPVRPRPAAGGKPPLRPAHGARRRVPLSERTLRRDRWWLEPALTVAALLAFIAYSTFRAFENANYYADPYVSPFYSPCIAENCSTTEFPTLVGDWYTLSPALLILVFPLGFRLTCYYYRKAYYRAFWQSPPACAVAEPHGKYTGETRFPLVFQNAHRYFFYAGLVFNAILTYDAFHAFSFEEGPGVGLGTLVLLTNAALLWLYSLSCHSCRHIVGGKMKHFSKHPVRYKLWSGVSVLNGKHMRFAWASLVSVALADVYVRLVASGAITDPRITL